MGKSRMPARVAREVRYAEGLLPERVRAAVRERGHEFSSGMAASMAGIAADPGSRLVLEDALDRMWEDDELRGVKRVPEIVVGGGLHAAIYCAGRVARGFPRPLVLEAGRVGGAFACSRGPSFYLNSRNRPGDLSVPGREGALNFLPGAPFQPSDLSGDEYQRNSDLAFVIRMTLAMFARVGAGRRVTDVTSGLDGVQVGTDGPGGVRRFVAGRVIQATGLGESRPFVAEGGRLDAGGEHVVSFEGLMGRMDGMFPLRGLRSVAVIGAGDSGRTAVEALLGQGPATGMSVASLDFVERIDWYGCEWFSREEWEECNRSRYRPLGRFFPLSRGASCRVNPVGGKVPDGAVQGGSGRAFVSGVPYDLVVVCVGRERRCPGVVGESRDPPTFSVGGRPVARANGDVFTVGPAAALPVSALSDAPAVLRLAENATAVFRYADRTAALAAFLPDVPIPLNRGPVGGRGRPVEVFAGLGRSGQAFSASGAQIDVALSAGREIAVLPGYLERRRSLGVDGAGREVYAGDVVLGARDPSLVGAFALGLDPLRITGRRILGAAAVSADVVCLDSRDGAYCLADGGDLPPGESRRDCFWGVQLSKLLTGPPEYLGDDKRGRPVLRGDRVRFGRIAADDADGVLRAIGMASEGLVMPGMASEGLVILNARGGFNLAGATFGDALRGRYGVQARDLEKITD